MRDSDIGVDGHSRGAVLWLVFRPLQSKVPNTLQFDIRGWLSRFKPAKVAKFDQDRLLAYVSVDPQPLLCKASAGATCSRLRTRLIRKPTENNRKMWNYGTT